MILPLILTAAIVAVPPPSDRAIRERAETITQHHVRRRLPEGSGGLSYYQTPVFYTIPLFWCDQWPLLYPPCAGQLPPHWDDAYGAFFR